MIKAKNIYKIILSFIILVLFAFYMARLIRVFTADVFYAKSQVKTDEGDYKVALNYLNSAINKNPSEQNYYRERAKVRILMAVTKEGTEVNSKLKFEALCDLVKAYNLNPDNLVNIRNSVTLYYYLSLKDYSQSPSIDNWDDTFLPIMQSYLSRVKSVYSHDAGVVSLIAKYEKRLYFLPLYDESIEIIKGLRP